MDELKTLARARDVLARRRSVTFARLSELRAIVSTTKQELARLGEHRQDLERRCDKMQSERSRATSAYGLRDNDRDFRSLVHESNELTEQSAQCHRRLERLKERQQSLTRQLAALTTKSDHLSDRRRRKARRTTRRAGR